MKNPEGGFEAKLQELIDAQPWNDLREERNKRLIESDKFATVDYLYATEEVKQAYVEYRQALRDLPRIRKIRRGRVADARAPDGD